jgi:hypothetical protein
MRLIEMPRGKRTVRAPALDNALIRALVAELPLPAKDGFPGSARESWIAMARHAFDVVYGMASSPVQAYVAIDPPLLPGELFGEALGPIKVQYPADGPRRFYVDHDGFAMIDGQPLAFNELPSIVTLWDERVGYEAGDVTAILWKDVGTVQMPLPPGVRLMPVTAKDAA